MVLDLKQVDLKQVRDDVSDRVGRAAKELSAGATSAARELSNTAQKSAKKQLPKRRGTSRWAILLGGLAGALVAYLFDPQHGKTRRAVLVDWTTARLRRGTTRANQMGRYAATFASGKMVSLQTTQRRSTPDDETLRDRIESEVFRDPEIPKGDINIDVNSGIVTIRGAVDNAFRIAAIEKAVFKVPGVAGVENLLHVTGTPAPNKQEAREASS